MKVYRIYQLDAERHSPRLVSCKDDKEAELVVRQIVGKRAVEIRRGKRKVATIKP